MLFVGAYSLFQYVFIKVFLPYFISLLSVLLFLLTNFQQAVYVFCLLWVTYTHLYDFFHTTFSWLQFSYVFIFCPSLRGLGKLTVNCISSHVTNLPTRFCVTQRPAAVSGQIYDDRGSQLVDKVQRKMGTVERKLERVERTNLLTISHYLSRSTRIFKLDKALIHLAHRNVNTVCEFLSLASSDGGNRKIRWRH